MSKRRYPPERVTETGWSQWIRPYPRSYLMACCDCGLVHELQFKAVKHKPFNEGEHFALEPVRGADAVFRARRKPRLTAQHRKDRSKARDD